MTRRYKKIQSKPYHDKQSMLFPPNLNDIVQQGHPVRIVDSIIDNVHIQSILAIYRVGATSGL